MENEIINDLEPKKNNTKKIAIIAIVVIGLLTTVGLVAMNLLGGTPQVEILKIFNNTMEQMDDELELFEKTHNKNLTSLFNDNANGVTLGLEFEEGGFINIPKIQLNTRVVGDAIEYDFSVDNIANLMVKANDSSATISLSNDNIYEINGETLGMDLVKWFNDNDMPLDPELEESLELLSVENEIDYEKQNDEIMKIFTDFMLKGNYEKLESEGNVDNYAVSFSDTDVKELIIEIFKVMKEDANTLKMFSQGMEIEESELTEENLRKRLDESEIKEFNVKISAVNGILKSLNIYIEDSYDNLTLNMTINDVKSILNGVSLGIDGNNGSEVVNVSYEAELFNKDLLYAKVILDEGNGMFVDFSFDYSFDGEGTYDNGTISLTNDFMFFNLDSTLTSIDDSVYFDVSLPKEYEMFLGKGRLFISNFENNEKIVLDNATSNLFDNSVEDFMANENETINNVTNFISSLSFGF